MFLVMVTGLKQPLRELLLSGAKGFADTALYFFPNILNWIYTWAVSWPFRQLDVEFGDDSSQHRQYGMMLRRP
jgi:hypothetical protein